MNRDEKSLCLIYKNADMGVVGITSVLKNSKISDTDLNNALVTSRTEYEKIRVDAKNELNARGFNPKGVSIVSKLMSDSMAMMKMKYASGGNNSKIAEMMIQGSSMGTVKLFKNAYPPKINDGRIRAISEKLLKTEENNIVEMRKFL